jgi:hypothetical protein
VDAAGDLFITDDQTIREVNASTDIITTVAGNTSCGYGYSGDGGPPTSAQLCFPQAVAVDAAGDLFIADSFNGVIREVSDKALPTVSIAASAGSVAYGQSLTFTATVSPETVGGNTPTGTVEFFDGTTCLGSAVLNTSGVATLTTSTLAVGQHDLVALYVGDSSDFTAVSPALSVTVTV